MRCKRIDLDGMRLTLTGGTGRKRDLVCPDLSPRVPQFGPWDPCSHGRINRERQGRLSARGKRISPTTCVWAHCLSYAYYVCPSQCWYSANRRQWERMPWNTLSVGLRDFTVAFIKGNVSINSCDLPRYKIWARRRSRGPESTSSVKREGKAHILRNQ